MDPLQIPIRDLHLPPEIGWWPLAPGWWGVIAVAAVGLLYLLYRGVRRYRFNRARRYALLELRRAEARLAEDGNVVAYARSASELLRRTMLAYAPRSEIAGLTGDAWLERLDRGLGQPRFTSGSGRPLATLPYRDPGRVADVDVDGLRQAVRERLLKPFGEAA